MRPVTVLLCLYLSLLCTPTALYSYVNQAVSFSVGMQTLSPEATTISPLINSPNTIELKSKSLIGTGLFIGYNYYPDPDLLYRFSSRDFDIGWLGFLAEINIFVGNGGGESGTQRIVMFINNVPVATDLKYEVHSKNAFDAALNLGPKIALIASDPINPWSSSNWNVSGGWSFFSSRRLYNASVSFVDPSFYFEDGLKSRSITGTQGVAEKGVSGFIASGYIFKVSAGLSITMDWKYFLYFKSHSLSFGLRQIF